LPRFDSDSCFSGLLGDGKNGRWLLAPKSAACSVKRRYLPGALILETTFSIGGASARIIDFMALERANSTIIRIVEGIEGDVEINTELVVRFDNGATVPWVDHLDDGSLSVVAGPHMLLLRSEVPLHGKSMMSFASLFVRAGQRIRFALSYHASWLPLPAAGPNPDSLLSSTRRSRRDWSDRYEDAGVRAEAVKRSLITLKALTYRPTGGIVAAATTDARADRRLTKLGLSVLLDSRRAPDTASVDALGVLWRGSRLQGLDDPSGRRQPGAIANQRHLLDRSPAAP
jgi:GH15 family glucan-1,4-alpha-glucosidase